MTPEPRFAISLPKMRLHKKHPSGLPECQRSRHRAGSSPSETRLVAIFDFWIVGGVVNKNVNASKLGENHRTRGFQRTILE